MMPIALFVANNADLYDAVYKAHGLARARTGKVWSSFEEAPAYYSNFLLLDPRGKQDLIKGITQLRKIKPEGFTFKDGFCVIDGELENLSLLFSASWIMRKPESAPLQAAPWKRIGSGNELADWEKAWAISSPTAKRNFPESVLDDSSVAFFGAVGLGGFTGGCIVNFSNDCTGLSNVFGGNYEDALACALSIAEGKPVVGYERGADLKAAIKAGFETVAPLNIWNVA